ncbi:dihydrolipoamide acetyltransferase family protein [Streptantibioticus rubrisoli]|uniref:Dihydrolipoamide acetyltransferase component of pyruvate dehydrogenase complex n=1 Tax=Streptantibioticus rubrisoli TaxID=1387313 RepID=A0ABT1PAJ2_9ACTN|nr:dihydrolipoamide acetyltransferase family protein [Streptantibioticus rubrisoli]MCQ4041463.1 2-oxo acid dehydrogenase subunit E2 [Streptantibioticus rubrisoli]
MTEILMPRLSDTMEEGVIATWHKRPGDEVAVGDVLVDIETDKALMEHTSYEAGTLVRILAEEGATVSIGAPIGILRTGDDGDDASGEPTADAATAADAPEPAAVAPEPAPAPVTAPEPVPVGIRSSPLARRLAREHGLDIAAVSGTGPGGRVVRADIERAIKTAAAAARAAEPTVPSAPPAATPPTAPAPQDVRRPREVELGRLRKVAAARLVQSKQQAPHFYLRRSVDAESLLAFRADANCALRQAGVKVSVNDLVIKACATALRRHPEVNASYADDRLWWHDAVHIGFAAATDRGLLVPVIHDADRMSVSSVATASRALAEAARAGTVSADQLSGGTFTVSNLGMYGVDEFAAVVNPPQAAILAVGALRERAVVRDGALAVRNTVELCLSIDHRVCDGATGAAFLSTLAELLENPLMLAV